MTEEELERIIVANVCNSLYFYVSLKTRPHLNPYAVGGALIIEFLYKGKALFKRSDGFHLDSYRALIAFNQLTSIIEYYIALGNYKEVQEFLKRVSMKRIFTPFASYLKDIPKENMPLGVEKKRDIR